MSIDLDLDFDISPLLQGPDPVRRLASGIDISNYTTIAHYKAAFEGLFNHFYSPTLTRLVQEFNSILSLGESAPTSYGFTPTTLSLSASSILQGNKLNNINCKEGEYAYQYYVECIVLKLNELQDCMRYANQDLDTLEQLEQSDSVTMEDAQTAIDRLKMLDALAFELIGDFGSHFVFKTDSRKGEYAEYWDEEFIPYFSQGDTATPTSKIGTLSAYPDLEALRQLKVQSLVYDTTSDTWSTVEKELTSFNELTLLDKLKYICIYYKLDLSSSGGESRIIFPDDAMVGFPCVPNVVSTSAIEDTKELGALELFYVGYLIDRDGPVNALSSFLAVKTQALRTNVSIMMNRITALKQYVSFMRRALELLNTSQASGENRIPDAAYWALTYVGGSIIRSLMELRDSRGNYLKDRQGKEIRDPFMVIQCRDISTDDGYHFTSTNRYLLVKATEDGLKALLGDGIVGSGNDANSNGKSWGFDRTFLNVAGAGKLDGLITSDNRTVPFSLHNFPAELTMDRDGKKILVDTLLPTALDNTPYPLYDQFTWAEDLPERYGLFQYTTDGNIYLAQFDDQEQSKQWLPKEIQWYPMNAKPLGYTSSHVYWRNRQQRPGNWPELVKSWTTTMDTIVENLKSCIEGINNEISSMRSKIDTLDSASATFRKRVTGIYRTIIGNIG
ncbi:MAG: hypothetical protein LBF43_01605 [Puniceicoccales bacterium]|jgi:hypothetical protein|nr:hypothetical protein [Puniceicoccales bacterium]